MKLSSSLVALLLLLFAANECAAHFGIVIPSSSTVMQKEEAAQQAIIAFAHPFTAQGLEMAKPQSVFLAGPDGKRQDLTGSLASTQFMDKPAWKTDFRLQRPGAWQLASIPEPYFEPAEDCYIIHYAKTVMGAYGAEDGWEKPLGLPMEIVPLTRPFANYAGNIFTGTVLQNGKPLANAPVEVEFLNREGKYSAPNEYFETQQILTDCNGNFAFSVPWAGWWAFAALAEAPEKLKKDGVDKAVETGAIIWLEFTSSDLAKTGK